MSGAGRIASRLYEANLTIDALRADLRRMVTVLDQIRVYANLSSEELGTSEDEQLTTLWQMAKDGLDHPRIKALLEETR